MPLMKYFVFVGSALVVFLLTMNWYLHEPTAEPVYSNIERPVIRISSIEKLPERVVFDTSMPYMAPPSSVVSGAAQALQSSFTFDQRAPAVLPARPTLAPVAPKKSITAKREPAKVISTHRAAPPTNTAAKNNTVRETELDTRPPVKTTLLEDIAGRFGQIFKVN